MTDETGASQGLRAAGEALVRITKVTKRYGSRGRPALDEVGLRVAPGESVAVMGPSGSGKSTLLNLIAGLDRPTSGTVTVAGQRIDTLSETRLARYRRQIGMVFQFFNLLEDLTVLDNVLMPAQLAGMRGPGRGRGHTSCWHRWGSTVTATPTRAGCPAASGSGSRSPARW
jgi:putative ABC transport system ATP-binding protein